MTERESGIGPLAQSNTPPMTKDGRAAPPWVRGGLTSQCPSQHNPLMPKTVTSWSPLARVFRPMGEESKRSAVGRHC